MQIQNETVVTLHYTLTDDDGNLLDKSNDGSFAYLHGANNIIIGLENALTGKTSGDQLDVSVAPEEGYGMRNDAMLQEVPKEMFEDESQISVGQQFHAQGPDGQVLIVTVSEVQDDKVIVDGNHPLAGVNLNFDVTVVDVRDATAEEIEHGQVGAPAAG